MSESASDGAPQQIVIAADTGAQPERDCDDHAEQVVMRARCFDDPRTVSIKLPIRLPSRRCWS